MAKKKLDVKDIDKRINELKIELLKQTQKRKTIKKEIARALTMKRMEEIKTMKTKSGGKK